MNRIQFQVTRALIGLLCALSVLSLPSFAQTQHYDFTYPDRTSFLAAGWDFLALSSAGVTRNTEQTTGAVVSYNVAPGVLQIPVDSGDLWGTQNDSRNTVFRSVPTDWTSMRLSLSFAPTTSYQQVGLVAYQDDDNYVNITRIFNGANQVSFAVEQNANPSVVNSATVTATTFYLRLDRNLTTNTITGSYSLDGVTWVQVSSTVLALNNPQLAIFAGGSPSGLPNAKINWAEYDAGPLALAVSSVSMTPPSVTGGGSSQGTVTLNGAAPAGGATVLLGSSNTAVATAPASVTVAAGQTTATFSVTTTAVTTATPAIITASYSGSSANATLTVNPASSSLTEYDFTYPDRTSFLAAGWDFLAVSSAGVTRNTEQTTGAVVSYNVAPGVLQIPVDTGDLWGTQNNSRNTVFHSVPTDWTSMRLNLSFAPTTSYQQIGLVAYQDDDNYVNITRIFNGTNLVAFAVEKGANASVVNSASVTATSFYLRLDRDPTTNTITGFYSLDNVTWVQVSSTVLALNNPQLAIFAGGSPSGLPNAKITWAQVAAGSSALGVTLGLNPSSVAGGVSSQGTVTLSSAAPAGGAVVTLGSSNAAVAAVPASVTVAAGQTTATFSVTTTAVTTATPATITASYSGSSGNATLTVNPAAISSLSLNPTTVTGGTGSTGTVTLTGVAPNGGFVVTLGSNNTAVAAVPASVTVAAGQTTATFSVTTTAVTTVTTVTITATSGTSSGNATLTVNPAAIPVTISSVSLSPTSVTGGTSSLGTVTLTAVAPTGGAVVTLGSSSTAAGVPASVTVAAGQTTATFSVTTTAVATVTSATITGSYNSSSGNAILTVNPPVISSLSLSPTTVTGGASSLGTVKLSAVAPTGGAVVTLGSSSTAATVPASVTVAAGQTTATFSVTTTTVAVVTTSTITGSFNSSSGNAALTINPVVNTVTVSSVSLNPTSVTGGAGSTGTVTLSAVAPTGGAVVTLGSSSTSATVPASVTVTAGQTTATFSVTTTVVTVVTSATITGSYNSSSANAILTVNPASSSFTEYDFTYPNRTSFLAAGWDFLAVTATGASRNTEQTTGAVVSYNVAPGVLQIPVDTGDLWGTQNNSRNTVFRSVPTNWTSMRLNLSFAPTTSYQQIGLVAYQDDDNYVNITRIFNGTNLVAFAVEKGANASVVNSASVTATSFYLRLDRDPTTNTITGFYSLDNVTWVQVSSTVLALNNPQLAIFAGGSPSGLPNAKITWAQVMTGSSGSGVTLGLNPTSVTGGTGSTGTVTLTAAAPTGGAVVTLGSSSAAATVPASVTVAAGQTTATFSVTTTAVSTATPVTITASYSGSSGNAILTVNPPAISTVSLNPTAVAGGAGSTGTVTLSSVAPTGGAVVTLSSNSTAAAVPSSVTVAAGQTTATFSVTTTSVTTTTTVTITGTSGSSSAHATLTVNPGAVDPTLSFRRPITVTNSGSALTNYQVKISLTSSNMTFSHAKSDGSDVRLRASDGVTDLPYWIENWNSSSQTATLWVNASSLPAGTSTLYLVYGNSSATTTASGTNTFLFFDDFSTADPTTDLGYMQESAVGVVNMGAAQAWEGGDVPHFFSALPVNGAIDGKTYTYWAYYGTHNVPGVGIGLAGSNDMVNWTKYSGNPVITGDSRAPSVVKVGSTFSMAYEMDQQIGYATSTDGIHWTQQGKFVSDSNKDSTPHLWQNPNDSKLYLYWTSNPTNTSLSGSIMVRSATTVAGLLTASATSVWNNWLANKPNGTVYEIYAPHIYYDAVSSSYLLMFESQPPLPNQGDTNWDVIVLRSSSPTSGFSLAPGNSYHPGGYACPENYVAGTTLYTYYCYNTGSTWQIRYTTASIAAGRQVYSKPKGSLWTRVEPSANTQAPNWYLTPCTDWKGAAGQCLKGFGRFGQAYNGQVTPSYLASAYSGTNYIMEARLYPIDSPDALVAARIAGTSSPGKAFNAMLNYGSNTLNQEATPGLNQISTVNVGSVPLDTWYHVVTTVQGTTMTTSFNDGASTTTGTSSADTSGSAGPGLDMQSTSMFDNIFVHQYAATVPTNSVGSEQSGSF